MLARDEDLDFLGRSGEAVRGGVPDGEVLHFGSRARGDAADDSDLDLVVVVPDGTDRGALKRIREWLYDLELDSGVVISTTFVSRREWEDPLTRATPLWQEIGEDGIAA
jgi:predicted nucleotidyltransferase